MQNNNPQHAVCFCWHTQSLYGTYSKLYITRVRCKETIILMQKAKKHPFDEMLHLHRLLRNTCRCLRHLHEHLGQVSLVKESFDLNETFTWINKELYYCVNQKVMIISMGCSKHWVLIWLICDKEDSVEISQNTISQKRYLILKSIKTNQLLLIWCNTLKADTFSYLDLYQLKCET